MSDRDQWEQRILTEPRSIPSSEDLDQMFEASERFGNRNGWTGTTGTLAAMIRKLLRERTWLINLGNKDVR